MSYMPTSTHVKHARDYPQVLLILLLLQPLVHVLVQLLLLLFLHVLPSYGLVG